MDEQTAVAETSPAPVMEASRGSVVNLTPEQRTEWKKTGELPGTPKTEEPAASTVEAPSSETAPEGEAKPEPAQTKPQEKKPKPTADERIAQLEATIEKIRKGSGSERKTETAPVAQTPPSAPQTRPKPTAEEKDGDKPKYSTYEDFVEDLADWKAEQRIATQQREQQEQNQKREFSAKVAESEQRYGDKFKETVAPAANAISEAIPANHIVQVMLNESEVLPDLLFTIGSDAAELADFVKMAKENPGKALRYIALTESLIRDELAQKPAKTETPVKPQTQAPKPPAEVGGRATSPGDQLTEAAKAGDFRAFKAESTRRELARMKS